MESVLREWTAQRRYELLARGGAAEDQGAHVPVADREGIGP